MEFGNRLLIYFIDFFSIWLIKALFVSQIFFTTPKEEIEATL